MAVLSACAGADRTPPAGDRAATADACRAEAERRFADTPAVSSGLTTYVTGGEPEALYRDCMRRRGLEP